MTGSAPAAAQRLLGCELERLLPDGTLLRGRIIETEAYDQTDPASHSFRGRTERTQAMFGPPGHAYVYLSYGMHHCFNITCGPDGFGAGVLIRSLLPLAGIEEMRRRRKRKPDNILTDGPGKVCQAFDIDMQLYGHSLRQQPLRLVEKPAVPSKRIVVTARIGISQAQNKQWRFLIVTE